MFLSSSSQFSALQRTPMAGLLLMMLSDHVLHAQTSKVNAALVGTVETFNLLNRVNVSGINPVWGDGPSSPLSGFDQHIEAFDARQVQLSIDFEF